MPKSILLINDRTMFRAGLVSILRAHAPAAAILEAPDGNAALRQLEKARPSLIILDFQLAQQNGMDVARQILNFCPEARIVLLSAEPRLPTIREALKVGVAAYLVKSSAPAELSQAMGIVLAGKLYLCPEAGAVLLQDYRRVLRSGAETTRSLLSAREEEVLRLVAEGLRGKEIAARLNLGLKTVGTYRRRLMQKLGYGSTAELVRYAIREGMVQL